MPIMNGIGVGPETATKQKHFRGILDIQINAAKNYTSERWPYLYLDLNAGDGTTPVARTVPSLFDDEPAAPGSALIFLEEACKALRKEPLRRCLAHFHAVFFELDSRNRDQLTARTSHCPRIVVAGDHAAAVEYCKDLPRGTGMYGKGTRGLIYSDPNGTDVPWELLARLVSVPHMRKVDILINYQATAHKRVRRVHARERLEAQLAKIGKQYVVIREPHDRHQWTFLLLTNWEKFPAWEKQEFYRLQSPQGQAIFERICNSAAELAEREVGCATVPLLC